MADTFTWRVHATASGNGEFDVRKAKFGDGYSQAVASGLNNHTQKWSVSVSGYDVPGAEGIRRPLEFLIDKAGAESFFWTPPLGEQGRYECSRYSITPQGGGYFVINAEFEQVYRP